MAEILLSMVPLSREHGLDVSWEVIEGDEAFFACTKTLHNSLQGMSGGLSDLQGEVYMETNRRNAERLRPILEEADYVFIHDPQPAALLNLMPERKGKWVWRCHIDVSAPNRSVWRFVKKTGGGVRRVHLLPPRLCPASPPSSVSDHSEHRPPERKKYPPFEARGGTNLRGPGGPPRQAHDPPGLPF